MTSQKFCISYFLLFLHISTIYCQNTVKGSLIFVIDDTGSMQYEIEEVKKKIDSIYDAAMSTNDPFIENIIILTFNDPEIQLRTITKNREELKEALLKIQVRGGGDCPEVTLSGIRSALDLSLPFSTVFVFTDASAKDYGQFEDVRRRAARLKIRIFFILTGSCRGIYEDSYQVYYRLANATSGQVFNVLKTDVNDIIPIVIQNMRSRRHVLVPEGPKLFRKSFKFTVYKDADEAFIYIRAKRPQIHIIGPEGKTIRAEESTVNGVLMVKVQGQKPGEYNVEVTGDSEITLQFLGNTIVLEATLI